MASSWDVERPLLLHASLRQPTSRSKRDVSWRCLRRASAKKAEAKPEAAAAAKPGAAAAAKESSEVEEEEEEEESSMEE